MAPKRQRTKKLVAEIRKLREQSWRDASIAERHKEDLRTEIANLHQRIDKLLEPVMRYARFYANDEAYATSTVPTWKLTGSVCCNVKFDVNNVRMMPYAHREAWEDELCRHFARNAYEAAKKQLRIIESP